MARAAADRNEDGLRSQLTGREVVLGWNAESIRHAVKKCEDRRHVNGLSYLILAPTRIAHLLHVVGGGPAGALGDELDVLEQGFFSVRQSGFVELALENRRNALISGSLNPQEVSVTVQSIRTPVEIGDVTGNHLLVSSGEIALGKVHCVRKFYDLAQEVRARSEALDDSGYLPTPGTSSPEIVCGGGLASSVLVLDNPNLGWVTPRLRRDCRPFFPLHKS